MDDKDMIREEEIREENIPEEDIPEEIPEEYPEEEIKAPLLGGTKDAPVLRSGSAAGVRFLGYLDEPEELLRGARRCLYGCDSGDDAAYLPTTSGMTLEDGSTTAVPAPWSIALVRGGDMLALGADGTWGTL